jgi:hypothetical protein
MQFLASNLGPRSQTGTINLLKCLTTNDPYLLVVERHAENQRFFRPAFMVRGYLTNDYLLSGCKLRFLMDRNKLPVYIQIVH